MNISINKPCHENWEKMTPNEQGAFCSVCTKNVIDFSQKTITEIKEFFSTPKESRTCGRFRNEQLVELSFDAFFERFSGWKLNRKVTMIIATVFLSWFVGLNQSYAQQNTHKVGKINVSPDTAATKHTTKHPVKNPKDTTTSVQQPEKFMKGEVYVPDPKRKEEE